MMNAEGRMLNWKILLFCILHSAFPSVPIISRFVGAST